MNNKLLPEIFSTRRAAVLQVLLEVNDFLSIRHIARLAEISPQTAAKALRELEHQHVVECWPTSSAIFYRLAEGNYAVPALKKMINS